MNKIYLFSISSHPKATHINSLSIKFLQPKIDFTQYNYLIITSKQVATALQNYTKDEYKDLKALCISKQSAKSFQSLGGEILEICEGYGDSIEKYITKYDKGIRWLYLRAKVVASDFAQKCRDKGYSIDERVLYESECSQEIQECNIEENATLIFTSPSSVHCYLKTKEIMPKHNVIVIGKTTAKALPEHINYRVAKEPTIESCISLLQ